MTPLEQARATLDGVEPILWGHKALNTLIISNTPLAHLENVALYSRETVESLLQAHELRIRKQVLLEAAEVVSKIPVSVGYSADGAYESTSQTLCDAAEELRRMADDLEGGKV